MQVYRISKTDYINNLTGAGAEAYGGRWNRKGTRMVYTAESRSLASVEYLVHVPFAIVPYDLSIASIEITGEIKAQQLEQSALPKNWREFPAPNSLATIGSDWAKSRDSLLLRVPSAVVDDEFNILINPLHPDFHRVKVKKTKEYTFDYRLLRN